MNEACTLLIANLTTATWPMAAAASDLRRFPRHVFAPGDLTTSAGWLELHLPALEASIKSFQGTGGNHDGTHSAQPSDSQKYGKKHHSCFGRGGPSGGPRP